jgi:hypothetical protein
MQSASKKTMTNKFLLFDMDGVLVAPGGYRQALKSSIRRMGRAIGIPKAEISEQQIAHFEALSITNEWDTLAICTALMLIQVWEIDHRIRLTAHNHPSVVKNLTTNPNFQQFLNTFTEVGPLPGHSAFKKIKKEFPGLNLEQLQHLKEILYKCRDINNSLTLPSHQETVLGSHTFNAYYGLEPQLNTESFLLKYDKPAISSDQQLRLINWLENQKHYAGILTNRPNSTPEHHLSAPEAEMGARLVGMDNFPILGSGMLYWYAKTQSSLPEHSLLKPNSVHVLALLQICLGKSPSKAIHSAFLLWRDKTNRNQWQVLQGANVIIFEDSLKGLQSGIAAKSILRDVHIDINLELIGVTDSLIKKQALMNVADRIISSVDQYQWPD